MDYLSKVPTWLQGFTNLLREPPNQEDVDHYHESCPSYDPVDDRIYEIKGRCDDQHEPD
jgi:hypothetical protein